MFVMRLSSLSQASSSPFAQASIVPPMLRLFYTNMIIIVTFLISILIRAITIPLASHKLNASLARDNFDQIG